MSKRSSKLRVEDPSGPTAFSACRRRALMLSLMISPLSWDRRSCKQLSRACLVNTPPSTPTPSPHTSSIIRPFNLWSPKNGLHIMATPPPPMLSSKEFQPQCVINAPIAACFSISSWGAHATIIPLVSFLSRNPSGRFSLRWSLRDHMNGTRLASKASASSTISSRGGTVTDPKLT
ncbi:hypothetical protein EUGRSUZ_A02965 [Eucalyptus grandis]|uniref:Uncharacterized protein n=2 Tax=Eucalyptus grandis TaxID=71139 RepID=A0ACC3M8C1_EUCGR|nr:hypothetical protein EUGRSUZ_A02965 [Eucalyptus grandis]